jgi:hypothetical protein
MSDPLVLRAFQELFPDKYPGSYDFRIQYSGKFNDYNANVKYRSNLYTFNLSRKWKAIDDDIKIGLIQSLLVKVFKAKKTTPQIDLYNIFVKRLHRVVPKTQQDPILAASFSRVNESFMNNLMEMPNLVWGGASFRTLGQYSYTTDTITMSKILADDEELLDYVMYHEMLHKKFKYYEKNGRSFHHTHEFKVAEGNYPNASLLEKKLGQLAARKRWRTWLPF